MNTTETNVARTGQEETHRGANTAEFKPAVDVMELQDRLVVALDMPGVDKDALDIRVEKGVLHVTGRVQTERLKGYRPVYAEYNIGNYARSFTLSDDVACDKITAEMTNGVLTLNIPKSERAVPRRISVKAV